MTVQSNNSCFNIQIDDYTLEIKSLIKAPEKTLSYNTSKKTEQYQNPIIDKTNNFVVVFKKYISNPDTLEFRGTLEDCVYNLSLTIQKHHNLGNMSLKTSIEYLEKDALYFDHSLLKKQEKTYSEYKARNYDEVIHLTDSENASIVNYKRYIELTRQLKKSNNTYNSKINELRQLIA